MSDEERSTRKAHEKQAWAGSREELERIGKIANELITARRATLLKESDIGLPEEAKPTNLELPNGQVVELPSTSSEMIRWQVDRNSIEREMVARATLVDGDDKLTGGIELVLSELDGRTVRTVKFFGGTSYKDGLEIEFGRDAVSFAVKVNVISPDQGWATQAFVRLVEEVNKRSSMGVGS